MSQKIPVVLVKTTAEAKAAAQQEKHIYILLTVTRHITNIYWDTTLKYKFGV